MGAVIQLPDRLRGAKDLKHGGCYRIDGVKVKAFYEGRGQWAFFEIGERGEFVLKPNGRITFVERIRQRRRRDGWQIYRDEMLTDLKISDIRPIAVSANIQERFLAEAKDEDIWAMFD